MNKHASRAKRAYQKMYRWIRLNGGTYHEEIMYHVLSDAQDCAILSYDERDCYFTGWINNVHKFKFRQLMAERFPRIWFNLR